ncbi:MAG: RNA-binding S4 domain-containing protein [Polyangiaceae bacterium]|nr:RNA-binding S4 domain-containing protein [Polyangiaceae bacterium]
MLPQEESRLSGAAVAITPTLRVRLDKWLWAARFYKTRSQASDAIAGGHVKGGGDRLKAGHNVIVGEQIEIVKDGITWEIEVVALSDKRGKGVDAAKLYRETDDGKARRLAQIEALKAAAASAPYLKGRPTKRDRRAIERLKAEPPRLGSSHYGAKGSGSGGRET